MRNPELDDVVRLTHDLPRCELHRGDRGVVRSTWFEPAAAYEVEFRVAGESYPVRVVLGPDEVALEERGAGGRAAR